MFDLLSITLFWIPVLLLLYHWLLFPLLLWFLTRFRSSHPEVLLSDELPSVTVAIAAYNEELTIAAKLRNCLDFDYPSDKYEVIVGSDSDDATDGIVCSFTELRVRLVRPAERRGKCRALNLIVAHARGDLILFTDADTLLSPGSLRLMVQRFSDPRVGVVQPHYRRANHDGSFAEGLFDRFDTWVKQLEGQLGAMGHPMGWAMMVRRTLCSPLPEDTILDDLLLGIRPFRHGYSAVYEPRALAMHWTENEQWEFRRRVKIGRGNAQALVRQIDLLSPKYGLKALVLASHKFFRAVIPLLLPPILVSCALRTRQPVFLILLLAQLLTCATTPLLFVVRWRRGLLPQYYLLMNIALLVGELQFMFRPNERYIWTRTERRPRLLPGDCTPTHPLTPGPRRATQQLRVAFDLRWLARDAGGVATNAVLLLQALMRRESEFRFEAILNPGTEGLVERYLGEPIPNLRPLLVPYSLFSLAGQFLLPLRLRGQGVAIYHSPNYLGLTVSPGVKLVVTIHDLNIYHHAEASPRSKTARWHRAFAVAVRHSLRRADAVLTASQTSAQDLHRTFPRSAEKVHVVHGIVNSLFFEPRRSEQVVALRRRLGITGTLVLYVGRCAPYKNVEALIQAVLLLRAEGLDASLVVAGDPDGYYPEQEFEALGVRLRPFVRFLGFVECEELAMLYQAADMLVFPSRFEGFGLPPLEAMASGSPVVCSPSGALPEVSGEAALYVEPTPPGIAEGIRRVVSEPNLRAELVRRGRRQASHYSPEAAAERVIDIYRRLLSRPSAGSC